MGIFGACMSMHHACAWCLFRSEQGIWFPGTVVTDTYELSCKYFKLSSGLLEEQSQLLTPSISPVSTLVS